MSFLSVKGWDYIRTQVWISVLVAVDQVVGNRVSIYLVTFVWGSSNVVGVKSAVPERLDDISAVVCEVNDFLVITRMKDNM